jgi:hypothetical protein
MWRRRLWRLPALRPHVLQFLAQLDDQPLKRVDLPPMRGYNVVEFGDRLFLMGGEYLEGLEPGGGVWRLIRHAHTLFGGSVEGSMAAV